MFLYGVFGEFLKKFHTIAFLICRSKAFIGCSGQHKHCFSFFKGYGGKILITNCYKSVTKRVDYTFRFFFWILYR